MTNLGNLFSLRSATRTVKSLVPAAVMVALGWSALKALMIPMPVMSLMRLPATFSAAYRLGARRGVGDAGVVGAGLCDRVEELESSG